MLKKSRSLYVGYTPGPWVWANPDTDEIGTDPKATSLRTLRKELVPGHEELGPLPTFILEAEMFDSGDNGVDMANQRLIAAAPDMYALLVDIIDDNDGTAEQGESQARKIRALLNKIAGD